MSTAHGADTFVSFLWIPQISNLLTYFKLLKGDSVLQNTELLTAEQIARLCSSAQSKDVQRAILNASAPALFSLSVSSLLKS